MTPPPAPLKPPVRGLLVSVVLNAVIPVLLYTLAKRQLGASEYAALVAAALFPAGLSIRDVFHSRSIDPVAVLSLLSVLASMLAAAVGGSPKLLLIRESFFTGAFGVTCLASLALARPMMFYFGRHFLAGRDAARVDWFNAGWENPIFRHRARLITIVWGVASLGEFLVRVVLVYTLPAAAVLVVSPIVLGGMLIGTIVWTFAYVRQARESR